MAARRPLIGLGKIRELDPADSLQVEKLTATSPMTFQDSVGGPFTLAQLAAAGTSSLQVAYDSSTPNPEILTDATRGALQIRRGSAADSDRILEGQNGAGTATFHVTGAGVLTAAQAAISGAVSTGALSVTGAITATTTITATGAIAASNFSGASSGTNTGDQTITLTGDVTGSGGGSFAATIANDAVTYAKMQNASAASILLGRGAGGGAGDLQEIVLGANLSMTGSTLNAATGGSGEANTASNVGTGSTGIFKQKTGVNLEFNGILGTNGVANSLNAGTNNVELSGVALLPRDGSRAMTAALDMGGQVLKTLGYLSINDTIAAGQNNYAPTGWDTADRLRLTLTGSQSITGFVAPTGTGTTRKAIINIDTADTLTLVNESASSTAANRITCPGGVDLAIPFGGAAIVDYDATASRWRPIAIARASAGDVVGPGSATDNAVARFDATTGKLIQNSVVTIDDTGNVNIPNGQTLQLNASVIGGRGFTVISPTALAATTNDYNPTNHQISDVQRIDLTGNQTLTGLTAPSGNTASIIKILCNIDATETLTIAHESASSSAANRILCPNNVNLAIPPRGSVTVFYDSTSSRWRAIEVNNGAIAAPASVLHSVRRSAQLTNITGTVFPGYDTTLATLNSAYWSYSSGSWTCNKAHRSMIVTRMSYQVNSGAVSARAACDIVQGSGGVYTNNLQTHRDSAYSTTDTEGHLTNYAIRDWAVNEQFRVYYYTNAGAMDILAAMNDCTVIWVADL